MVSTVKSSDTPALTTTDLLDVHLPTYAVAISEHLVVEADAAVVYEAAKSFDFMTTRSPVVTALMAAQDPGVLPGWLLLGEVPGREVAFGAVGTFWKPDIEWHDVTTDRFAAFEEPGWGDT